MEISKIELVNDDIHFRELDKEIKIIGNKCAANGMFNSGSHLQMLCDLLLNDIEIYSEKSYEQLSNIIKSGNLPPPESANIFAKIIEAKVKNICEKHLEILEQTISKICGLSDEPRKLSIKNELSFSAKAESKLNMLCSKYEALYAEYIQNKINEEVRMSIEKATLEKAEEANIISKSSKRASWIFGTVSSLIAVVALVVAYLAYKKP